MPTFSSIQDEIASMLSIPDEDLADGQLSVLDEYLEDLASQEADKVDGFAQFVRIQSALADACKEEAKRLAAKAKTAENRLGYLKARYLDTMMAHGLKKICGNAYTLSMRASESVNVAANLDALPDIYKHTKVEVAPDKSVIKEALKDGLAIPGCELVTNYSLQIR